MFTSDLQCLQLNKGTRNEFETFPMMLECSVKIFKLLEALEAVLWLFFERAGLRAPQGWIAISL